MPNITIEKVDGLIKIDFGDYFKDSGHAKAIVQLSFKKGSFPYQDLRRVAANNEFVMVRLANGINEEWYLSTTGDLQKKILEVDSIKIGEVTTEPTTLEELRILLESLMIA